MCLPDRKEDIPLLTKLFIDKYNNQLYRNFKGISEEVMRLFLNYSWEGNVRELEHVIEGAVNFAEGNIIEFMDLPPNLKSYYKLHIEHEIHESITEKYQPETSENVNSNQIVEEAEKRGIEKANADSLHNITLKAKVLGNPSKKIQYTQ